MSAAPTLSIGMGKVITRPTERIEIPVRFGEYEEIARVKIVDDPARQFELKQKAIADAADRIYARMFVEHKEEASAKAA